MWRSSSVVLRWFSGSVCRAVSVQRVAALNAADLLCQTELEPLEGTVHCGQILSGPGRVCAGAGSLFALTCPCVTRPAFSPKHTDTSWNQRLCVCMI